MSAPAFRHPIARVRVALEAVGLLLVLGSFAIDFGALLSAVDAEPSTSEFFEGMSVIQFFVLPLALLGLLIAMSPRLFFRWDEGLGVVTPQTAAAIGLLVTGSSAVFSVGGIIASISGGDDGEAPGEWVTQVGVAMAALAGIVLTIAAFVVLASQQRRPPAEPL